MKNAQIQAEKSRLDLDVLLDENDGENERWTTNEMWKKSVLCVYIYTITEPNKNNSNQII